MIPAARARVLIVDDSALFAMALRQMLEEDPRLQVVAHAADGAEAIRLVQRLSPDVVTMDLHMPTLGGIEAIAEIMAAKPTPILVMTADPAAEEPGLCFEALSRGALDLLPKPSLANEAEKKALCDRVHLLSTVPVVPHARPRLRARPEEHVAAAPAGPSVVGIVASTGGPSALARVIRSLPAELPFGIVIVQHLCPGFGAHLLSWLQSYTSLPVSVARHEATVERGTLWLAPDDHHVRVTRQRRITVEIGPAVDGHRPSGDVLLTSLARALGPAAGGVVLTGMGRDGAEGLLAVRRAGGVTLAQDGASSVVDGMPRAARELGAAQRVVTLDQIGPALLAGSSARSRGRAP